MVKILEFAIIILLIGGLIGLIFGMSLMLEWVFIR
jgi:hypothetical protein